MHRFRFSLLAMFGFVAVVAVACAALARPSQLWLVVVSASSLGCLFYAVLAAVYGRNARRAFWLGFAVVGWGYVAVEVDNNSFIAPTELVTDRLQSIIFGPIASPAGRYPPYWSPVYQTTSANTPVVTSPSGQTDAYAAERASTGVPVESEVEPVIVPSDPGASLGPATVDGSAPSSAGSFGYSTTSSYPINSPSLTEMDLEAFGQIAMWLWSPLLGFAGGLVALRLFHRRERQDGHTPTTG